MEQKKFAVLGGDLRQRALADGLREDGYAVSTFAVDGAPEDSLAEAMAGADYVILPLPAFTEDGCLQGAEPCRVTLDEVLNLLRPGMRVFGGKLEPQAARLEQLGVPAIDYLCLEEMAAANAVPTAEGAIQLAMQELPVTIQGGDCLVIGWGRIGKVLSAKLAALGARVTVSARREQDVALLRALGYRADVTARFYRGLGGYDLIVNTVPAGVLGRRELEQIRDDCVVIDLASKPGGVDWDAASQLNRTVIWALSLPGKVAPASAGRIIRDAILSYLDLR
jgi:dipicolinate synthase subunit A